MLVDFDKLFYIINNIMALTPKVNPVIIIPFFIKSINEYLISFSFNILSHIIPAKAPIGVNKAPKLDPIIVE